MAVVVVAHLHQAHRPVVTVALEVVELGLLMPYQMVAQETPQALRHPKETTAVTAFLAIMPGAAVGEQVLLEVFPQRQRLVVLAVTEPLLQLQVFP
jgi:hypothetical protein